MEWRCVNSPLKKMFKMQALVGKVMRTVLCDSKGVTTLHFLEHGQTINSDHYIVTLTELKAQPSRVRSEKKTVFLLQYDNTRLDTILKALEHVANLAWTLLSYLLYSLDLAPADFHLFRLMKNGMGCMDNIFLTTVPSQQL